MPDHLERVVTSAEEPAEGESDGPASTMYWTSKVPSDPGVGRPLGQYPVAPRDQTPFNAYPVRLASGSCLGLLAATNQVLRWPGLGSVQFGFGEVEEHGSPVEH